MPPARRGTKRSQPPAGERSAPKGKKSPDTMDPIAATNARVEMLEKAFLEDSKPFVSSGIESVSDDRLALYYTKEGDTKSPSYATFPLSKAAAKAVFDAGQPSLFGRDQANVLDESYRRAQELRPPNFALSLEIVNEYSILHRIQKDMSIEKPLRAVMSKLNAYPKGGFFKAHQDTPRGEDHIGTLTICLPSKFKGGELVVRHGGTEIAFDWATDVQPDADAEPGESQVSSKLAWTFLYSDCEHEVLPVTDGTRITIAYDIFTTSKLSREGARDPSADMLAVSLQAACKDPSFFPDGGWLAFALQHSYPIKKLNRKSDTYVAAQLKSSDQTWLAAAKAAKLQWRTCAVYDYGFDMIYCGREEEQVGKRYLYKGRDHTASKNFYLLEGVEMGENGDNVDMLKANIFNGKNVAWVTEPKEWSGKNSYVSYGNEYTPSYAYVQVALAVKIPPAAER